MKKKSKLIVVDVEADGPAPGLYSMVSFGAVIVEPNLFRSFYGKTAPITDNYNPFILKEILNITREEHLTYPKPEVTMLEFRDWLKKELKEDETPNFISDNPAFDWQFINYYFHRYVGENPFGWSARRIGDLWAGYKRYAFAPWKDLRITKHTHNPVDDARGNAEAILEIARYIRKLVEEIDE